MGTKQTLIIPAWWTRTSESMSRSLASLGARSPACGPTLPPLTRCRLQSCSFLLPRLITLPPPFPSAPRSPTPPPPLPPVRSSHRHHVYHAILTHACACHRLLTPCRAQQPQARATEERRGIHLSSATSTSASASHGGSGLYHLDNDPFSAHLVFPRRPVPSHQPGACGRG